MNRPLTTKNNVVLLLKWAACVPMTLEDIGRCMGMSKEQVRLHERNALRKIRAAMEKKA